MELREWGTVEEKRRKTRFIVSHLKMEYGVVINENTSVTDAVFGPVQLTRFHPGRRTTRRVPEKAGRDQETERLMYIHIASPLMILESVLRNIGPELMK